MTEAEKLTIFKNILGVSGTTQDDVLKMYLNFSGNQIIRRAYPFRADVTEVPSQYEHLQIEIAVMLYNKQGAEGQNYHSENGIHRTYESSGIGKGVLSLITPFVDVV